MTTHLRLFGAIRVGALQALALGFLALSPPAGAVEPQFRQVKLVDGRVLMVEILETEAQGLRVRVPQGEMLVSFELLLDMVPISADQFSQQAPWVVYFDVPPDLEEDTDALLKAIPGIQPQPVNTPGNGIDSKTAFAASACNRDVECIATAITATPWKWVLTGAPAATGGMALHSKLNTATDRAAETILDGQGRAELWTALHTALGLAPPTDPAPRSTTSGPPPTSGMDSKKVVALSFVPLPGLPSLAQSDMGGAALALGVVVPSTVIWVGAVGQSGQSVPEFGVLSFAGYYAVTVLANQVTGLRSLEKRRLEVTAVPVGHGGHGAALVVGGAL